MPFSKYESGKLVGWIGAKITSLGPYPAAVLASGYAGYKQGLGNPVSPEEAVLLLGIPPAVKYGTHAFINALVFSENNHIKPNGNQATREYWRTVEHVYRQQTGNLLQNMLTDRIGRELAERTVQKEIDHIDDLLPNKRAVWTNSYLRTVPTLITSIASYGVGLAGGMATRHI